MANPERLNQLILRNMLLEGACGDAVLKKIKLFNKGKKTPEDERELSNFIKKQVSSTTRDLLADEQISTFVDELSDSA